MKLVEWQDERGKKKRSWVRDIDGPEQGRYGIPAEPPDMELLDWDGIRYEIREALSQQGLYTWLDVERSQDGLSCATNVLKRHLHWLFRQQVATNGGKHGNK